MIIDYFYKCIEILFLENDLCERNPNLDFLETVFPIKCEPPFLVFKDKATHVLPTSPKLFQFVEQYTIKSFDQTGEQCTISKSANTIFLTTCAIAINKSRDVCIL